MIISVMKSWRFLLRVVSYFLKGDFVIGSIELTRKLPSWMIRLNKATILCTENYIFPEVANPEIQTRIADRSDIDEISRISRVSSSRINQMMDQGAVCFISSVGNNPPAGVSWSVNGSCYVRGLAFRHDVGPNGYYSVGSVTLPEARGQGLYLKAQCDKIRYEMAAGGNKFYGTIEFSNTYSYSLRIRQGYHPILAIFYLKILFLKICFVKNLSTSKSEMRFVIREPRGEVTII
jgi:hypothetical protein